MLGVKHDEYSFVNIFSSITCFCIFSLATTLLFSKLKGKRHELNNVTLPWNKFHFFNVRLDPYIINSAPCTTELWCCTSVSPFNAIPHNTYKITLQEGEKTKLVNCVLKFCVHTGDKTKCGVSFTQTDCLPGISYCSLPVQLF